MGNKGIAKKSYVLQHGKLECWSPCYQLLLLMFFSYCGIHNCGIVLVIGVNSFWMDSCLDSLSQPAKLQVNQIYMYSYQSTELQFLNNYFQKRVFHHDQSKVSGNLTLDYRPNFDVSLPYQCRAIHHYNLFCHSHHTTLTPVLERSQSTSLCDEFQQ